jgi:hypothetical protein
MGYDMYIIAPHHSKNFNDINFPLNNCELYKDPWYTNNEMIEYDHQVWRCWRDGKLHDEIIIPDRLHLNLVYCPWLDSFREEMNHFLKSDPNISKYAIDAVVSYLDWIEYWKQKNAKFYLSI